MRHFLPSLRIVSYVFSATLTLASSLASAQTVSAPSAPAAATPPTSATPVPAPHSIPSDHDQVVHRAGARYLGSTPVGDPPEQNNRPDGRVPVHAIGVRYWFSPRVGIEAGVGFGGRFGNASRTDSGTTTQSRESPTIGYSVHTAVPIALASTRHLTLSLAPFASFAHGMLLPPSGSSRSEHWMNLRVGATVGAELHFGFLGLPQLSMEARLGLSAVVSFHRLDQMYSGSASRTTDVSTQIDLATTVDAFSVDRLLTSMLSLTYYF